MTRDSRDGTLHWTQQIALIRHNLHHASLTHDFGFFKMLQAHALLTRTDDVTILTELLENNDGIADNIILNMEKFNAVIACVHEDAFKNVYGSILACVDDTTSTYKERRAMFREDMAQQKRMADESIDKMLNLAIDMIREQPVSCQPAAAAVLINGSTFAAQAIDVCLIQMDALEGKLDDRELLTQSWSLVENGVGAAISAMRGVFNLLAIDNAQQEAQPKHSRSQSVDNFAQLLLRRMSNVLSSSSSSTSNPSEPSRKSSNVSWGSVSSGRNSTSNGSNMPPNSFPGNRTLNFQTPSKIGPSGHHTTTLSPIRGTPTGMQETLTDPFELDPYSEQDPTNDRVDPDSPLTGHQRTKEPRQLDRVSSVPLDSKEADRVSKMLQDPNFDAAFKSLAPWNYEIHSTVPSQPDEIVSRLLKDKALFMANQQLQRPPGLEKSSRT